MLCAPLALTVTWSRPALLGAVATPTAGRGAQLGAGVGDAVLVAATFAVGVAVPLTPPPLAARVGVGVTVLPVPTPPLLPPGGKALGPPPTNVGQSPQPSVTTSCAVAAAPAVC
jgi:hypothetical protein